MLLENNQLIIVDIGASGGIDTRWKNLYTKLSTSGCKNKIFTANNYLNTSK